MARQLTEAMKATLRIMAEGHEIQLDEGCGLSFYPPRPGATLYHGERNVLFSLDLIERVSLSHRPFWVREVYALTEAGRRAAEEVR